ncbi:MAG TPA: hypothetical protein VF062_29620 [Candidatus Limnocylindrales bacterium]
MAGSTEALELARRIEASDVGAETLERLEAVFDAMAIAYTSAQPNELAVHVRKHLRYVGRLMDARQTLNEHRRLLVVGGWLSLLAATVHIDLRKSSPAAAWLRTADRLAAEAKHPEIRAWCLETAAWDELTNGRYEAAIALSKRAQAIAPKGSSALIQATAQEGRAWARMHRQAEALEAVERVNALVPRLDARESPEHHYRYDPDKALAYTATTLAWAGDLAAEEYARTVVQRLEASDETRPRRIAAARLDLGLALATAGKPDEAAAVAIAAIASGRVVPSNFWRANEVVRAVTRAGIREASDLREAYRNLIHPGPEGTS